MSEIEQAVAESIHAEGFCGDLWSGHVAGDHRDHAAAILAALAERGYHVTRSDREARLEAALLIKHYGEHSPSLPFALQRLQDGDRTEIEGLTDALHALLSEAPE